MSYIPDFHRQNKPSKYKNIKTEVDGILFDSKKEANRYAELKLLQRAKQISDLRLQICFEIIPQQVICGKKHRAIKYIADFTYLENGITICEDSKGFRTDAYMLKKRLMKQIHGIDVRET